MKEGIHWFERAAWATALLISVVVYWQGCPSSRSEDLRLRSNLAPDKLLDCVSVHAIARGFELRTESGFVVGTRILPTKNGDVVDTLVVRVPAEPIGLIMHSLLIFQVDRSAGPLITEADLRGLEDLGDFSSAIYSGCQ